MSDGYITIHLHGHLKQHLKEPFKVKARTLRQALTALQTIDAFNPQKTRRKVPAKIDHFQSASQLDDTWGRDEVHLRPEPGFAGSGFGDVLRVVVGIVLLVAAVILAVPTGGASLSIGMASLSVLASVVGSYFLQTGLQGLLYGKPTNNAPEEQKKSYFGSYQATTKSGTPIPIILGIHKWSGHLISFGMDVRPGTDLKLPPNPIRKGGWIYNPDVWWTAPGIPQPNKKMTWQEMMEAIKNRPGGSAMRGQR